MIQKYLMQRRKANCFPIKSKRNQLILGSHSTMLLVQVIILYNRAICMLSATLSKIQNVLTWTTFGASETMFHCLAEKQLLHILLITHLLSNPACTQDIVKTPWMNKPVVTPDRQNKLNRLKTLGTGEGLLRMGSRQQLTITTPIKAQDENFLITIVSVY